MCLRRRHLLQLAGATALAAASRVALAQTYPARAVRLIVPLAVTSRARAPIAPEVPTVGEAGFPALQLESLIGVFGPRGMPLDLRERIAADFRAVLAADAVLTELIAATGQVALVEGPAELAAGIAEQRAKLAAIAKTLDIRMAH